MALYELAVMGIPSAPQIAELERLLSEGIHAFGLRLGHEVAWSICPTEFKVPQKTPAAVAFFGGVGVSEEGVRSVLRQGIPVIPIASTEVAIGCEIPAGLKAFNCLTFGGHGLPRISTALLECVGLLPRQRRVFVSYRRDEAREAALQLFNALAAKVFDVFLDTHGIAPAEDFQAMLWHRLCDSDVLLMLDTANYFDSRWTNAEYGRALAKGISVLRVGWPSVSPSPRTATASQVNLTATDVDAKTGCLSDTALERICAHLEVVRGQSHAVRSLNLFSNLRQAVECVGGSVTGVGAHNAVYLKLADGQGVVAYPTVGVPTSLTLNDAVIHASGNAVAIVFDHIGLHKQWLDHLEWLGQNIQAARWVKISEAAWGFGGWGVS
jgi:TIR domain